MFGVPIDFPPKNAEISPVIATRDRFPIPKGWCNVYDIDPRLLIKKDYDRIIIVHRDLKTLMVVNSLYYPLDLSEDQRKRFKIRHKKDYEKVYGYEIDDPRFLRVDLDDFSNYTVSVFNEVMDFLNFPEMGRPKITPIIPPELRNWEVFSSLLERGQPVSNTLKRIANQFRLRDGLLEYMSKERDIKKEKEQIKLKNVLLIGPRIDRGCHFTENVYSVFKTREYNVQLLTVEELMQNEPDIGLYSQRKITYSLSKALEHVDFEPELILMEEPHWIFFNDVNIPVFYLHREFKRPPMVFYPDVGFFWRTGFAEFFRKRFASHWYANVPKFTTMNVALNPNNFTLKEKTIKGIVGITGRETINEAEGMEELTEISSLFYLRDQIEKFKKTELPYIGVDEDCMTDKDFRELLPQCEALWVLMPLRQFVSRRIIEAMFCKTIPVIVIENRAHESCLSEMGFEANEHYIKVKSIDDIKKLNDSWDYNSVKHIAEAGRKIVSERHLYSHRVDQIIDIYRDYCIRKKDVIVE